MFDNCAISTTLSRLRHRENSVSKKDFNNTTPVMYRSVSDTYFGIKVREGRTFIMHIMDNICAINSVYSDGKAYRLMHIVSPFDEYYVNMVNSYDRGQLALFDTVMFTRYLQWGSIHVNDVILLLTIHDNV